MNELQTKLNRGFTLIELLVAVLIIGILAAIALPQYRFAVLKSRMSTALPALKAMYTAQQAYFLANSRFATQFQDLEISGPSGCTGARCVFGANEVYLDPSFGGAFSAYISSSYDTFGQNLTISVIYEPSATLPAMYGWKSGTIICIDRNIAAFAKACQAFGGKNSYAFTGSGGGKAWVIE